MSQNNSSYGTADIRAYLDRALGNERGVKLFLGDRAQAVRLRQRIYSFRSHDRIASKKIYAPDHQSYGRSAYDGLQADITEAGDIEITKITTTFQIEDL